MKPHHWLNKTLFYSSQVAPMSWSNVMTWHGNVSTNNCDIAVNTVTNESVTLPLQGYDVTNVCKWQSTTSERLMCCSHLWEISTELPQDISWIKSLKKGSQDRLSVTMTVAVYFKCQGNLEISQIIYERICSKKIWTEVMILKI